MKHCSILHLYIDINPQRYQITLQPGINVSPLEWPEERGFRAAGRSLDVVSCVTTLKRVKPINIEIHSTRGLTACLAGSDSFGINRFGLNMLKHDGKLAQRVIGHTWRVRLPTRAKLPKISSAHETICLILLRMLRIIYHWFSDGQNGRRARPIFTNITHATWRSFGHNSFIILECMKKYAHCQIR